MNATDLILLGALGFGAWYLFFRSSSTSGTQTQTVGQQIYNDPTSVYQRLQQATMGTTPLLNVGQWNQLWMEYSTSPAPSVSIDPTARVTLQQYWQSAYGSLPAGMGWV